MSPLLIKSMLLVFFASVIGSFGAVFLKFGAMRLTSNILSFVNSRLILGVALYLASSVVYALGLKGGDLSVLYPMVALGYIWTLLWAKLFFQEPLTRYKIAGLGLILLGVFFVGMGSKEKPRAAAVPPATSVTLPPSPANP